MAQAVPSPEVLEVHDAACCCIHEGGAPGAEPHVVVPINLQQSSTVTRQGEHAAHSSNEHRLQLHTIGWKVSP
jgi:hypothetical protein